MLLHVLYLIGITAEAMTGALAAGRRRMDTFGVIIIATATAIGGGSVLMNPLMIFIKIIK
ncbi:TRIC cation channel family protein, partial [Salmonella enterica subsp. enterica serovar Schwarzengrund]|nr:TRIC cation channel family protein [Salmonella enterica subsp. enterica serovar Dublin]EJZ3660948.1 TRIC cation channel family protein [Salmonella enterica subsp. enterica serovar Schwarzengrund]